MPHIFSPEPQKNRQSNIRQRTKERLKVYSMVNGRYCDGCPYSSQHEPVQLLICQIFQKKFNQFLDNYLQNINFAAIYQR